MLKNLINTWHKSNSGVAWAVSILTGGVAAAILLTMLDGESIAQDSSGTTITQSNESGTNIGVVKDNASINISSSSKSKIEAFKRELDNNNTQSFIDFIDQNLGKIVFIDISIPTNVDETSSIKFDPWGEKEGSRSIVIYQDSGTTYTDYDFRGEHHTIDHRAGMFYLDGYFLVPVRKEFGQGAFGIILTSISREKVLLR